MQASYVSTAALYAAPRHEVVRLQKDLTARTSELATGRHADIGLALGVGAGRTVAKRMDLDLLWTLERSNETAAARLDLIQTGISDIREMTSEVLGSLIALPHGVTAARTLSIESRSALDRLADRLNASDGGSYLFAGTNTDTSPFSRFDAGPESAITAAFTLRFGMPPGDPATAGISAADIADFLATDFAALFDDPAWGADWSSASSTNVTSRIAPSEYVETSTNASETAFRSVAMGLSMIAGLGFEQLSDAARETVVAQSRQVLGDAVTQLVALQTDLGFSQNAIAKATDRLTLASDLVEAAVGREEGVDPIETKSKIDVLTTQLEMSYALTARISRLSILNYT